MAKLFRRIKQKQTGAMFGQSGKGGPGFEGSNQFTGISLPGADDDALPPDGLRRRRRLTSLGPARTPLSMK